MERSTQSPLRRELAVIPGWAYAGAVAVFVLIYLVFFRFVFWHEPLLPIHFVVTLLPATFLSLYMLMVGYVNRDAGRRGMSRALWTVLAIIIPNGIGLILYFLLRKPLQVQCPKCATVVDVRVNYCPRCGYSFHPTCAQCKAAIHPGDAFCGNCGRQLDQVA